MYFRAVEGDSFTEMTTSTPDISRDNRVSDEGLQRLEKQLKNNRKSSQQVLEQWIRRYGGAAQELIDNYRGK